MIRILYSHFPNDLYGSSRSLIRLIKSLDKTKYKPFVMLSKDSQLSEELKNFGVEIILNPTLWVIERNKIKSIIFLFYLLVFPFSVIREIIIIRKYKIDLVHTNSGIIISTPLASKLSGILHIWTIREWFGEFKYFWIFFSKYILFTSKRVICVSKAIAEQFPKSNKIVVIHNGFSLEEFNVNKDELRREFRKLYNISENEIVIGTVGRIKFKRKGQEYLVEAASILKSKSITCKFVIVGSVYPGNEEHLKNLILLIKNKNLEKDVYLIGEMQNPIPAYAAMDIFVLPSSQPEPFGGVVMEAMCMGLPVIATNIGGSPEQVLDNITGFLVPPANSLALADKLEILITNQNLRNYFGSQAKKRVKDYFSIHEMAKKILTIYNEAMFK